MSDTAVILAGGLGARLYPYTVTIPKPLVPVGQYSILEVMIRQLRYFGFSKVIITVNYQAEMVESFFRDGRQYGVEISYAREKKRLGTMGPLTGISNLPEKFLVANGDILTDIDLGELVLAHERNNSLLTVSTYQKAHEMAYGVIKTDSSGLIVAFEEKPCLSIEVSMGIYMMNRDVVSYIPQNKYFGFDDLMLTLLENNQPTSAFFHTGYWRDLGTPEDYQLACDEFPERESSLLRD
jgi:NDP-mannose synthase